jgi:hypothetical protein
MIRTSCCSYYLFQMTTLKLLLLVPITAIERASVICTQFIVDRSRQKWIMKYPYISKVNWFDNFKGLKKRAAILAQTGIGALHLRTKLGREGSVELEKYFGQLLRVLSLLIEFIRENNPSLLINLIIILNESQLFIKMENFIQTGQMPRKRSYNWLYSNLPRKKHGN